jgi:hypothetical protein
MAKLTSRARRALPARAFVFPKTRRYPIQNRAHALSALSFAGRAGGSTQKRVRAAVHAKYPSLAKAKRGKRYR